MTRYTNISIKRSYVEAGFNYRESSGNSEEAGPSSLNHGEVNNADPEAGEDSVTSGTERKRSRKRRKKNPDIRGESAPQGSSGGQETGVSEEKGGQNGNTNHSASTYGRKSAQLKRKPQQKGPKGTTASV
jgi:hypothetical protein